MSFALLVAEIDAFARLLDEMGRISSRDKRRVDRGEDAR